MPGESQTALKHQVAAGMRDLRERRGVTREEAAQVIHSSVQTIGHIETGRSLPSGLQLEKLLTHYGVPERIPQYIELRERAKSSGDWWTGLPGSVPAHRALFLGGESTADRVETFDPLLPDLVQTADHARARIRAESPGCSEVEVEFQVELLKARQQAVLENEARSVALLFTEQGLKWPTATAAMRREQARRLVDLAERPGVELRLLPMDVAMLPSHVGAFTLLSFHSTGEEFNAVYTETLVAGYYYEDTKDVAKYRTTMDTLREVSMEPEETVGKLARAGR